MHFLLSQYVIPWSSKKLSCIMLSIMEIVFMVCPATVQEAIWLKRFLGNLNVEANVEKLVITYYDSQTAIAYTKYAKYHSKLKDLETKYNFIKDKATKMNVTIKYISMYEMVADSLTKALTKDTFLSHARFLCLRRL